MKIINIGILAHVDAAQMSIVNAKKIENLFL